MKVVIDIPPEIWALVREGTIPVRAYECIVKGTPLPKGHGRLIDADELEPDTEWDHYEDGFISYSRNQIECADTIIEAESEESNGTL